MRGTSWGMFAKTLLDFKPRKNVQLRRGFYTSTNRHDTLEIIHRFNRGRSRRKRSSSKRREKRWRRSRSDLHEEGKMLQKMEAAEL